MWRPAFTDQRQRLRRIVTNALSGAYYQGSKSEDDGRSLLLQAVRQDGRCVYLRFRGVERTHSRTELPKDAPLSLVGIGGKFSFLRVLVPFIFRQGPTSSRVTIKAGDVRLDIVCEDAEWWEDEAPQSGPGR